MTFPFFDEDFVSAPDNDLPLFRRVFKPGIDNLAFIGLLQPLGAIMPLAEAQGRWLASYLRGEYRLPPRARDGGATSRDERERMFKRYVASKRHTMQVDFDNYLYELGKELKAGAARARAQRASALPGRGRAPQAGDGGARVTGAAVAGGKREQTKAQNRAAILAAAREVFAELGYDAAGVRDVIRRTELASGTFYNYFADKEAVFRAVRRRERPGGPPPAAGRSRSGAQTLEQFVGDAYRAWFEFLVEDELMFELMQRNAGPIRALFGDPILGVGRAGAARRHPAAIDRGDLPPHRRRLHGRRDGRRRARARRADGRALTGRRRGRGAVRHRAVPRRDRAPERGRSPAGRARRAAAARSRSSSTRSSAVVARIGDRRVRRRAAAPPAAARRSPRRAGRGPVPVEPASAQSRLCQLVAYARHRRRPRRPRNGA